MRYKKILVALAGEEEKKVIREAFRLNEQLNTSMRFLTVNNPRTPFHREF